MGRHFKVLLLLFLGLGALSEKARAQEPVSFQLFYDQLSPYGAWIDDVEYGYVWIPNVESGFTPYATNGFWAFTDAGWTWVSNYPWGWAPFHYGRWYNDAFYGPIWVPDNEWGPGWVNWRRSQSYYGWSPMEPGFGRGHHAGNDHWTFVRNRDFGREDQHRHYVSSSRNSAIMGYTKEIHNDRQDDSRHVTYNAGPDRAEVEKRGGRKFEQSTIRERNAPGQEMGSKEMQVYRPQVQKMGATGAKPAPGTVTNLKDVKMTPAKPARSSAPKIQTPMRSKSSPTQQTRQPEKQLKKPVQKSRMTPSPQQARPQENNTPQKRAPRVQQAPAPKTQPAPKKSKIGN